MSLDVCGEVERVLARQPLRKLRLASLERLDDLEVVDDRARGPVVLRDGRLADGTHVDEEIASGILDQLRTAEPEAARVGPQRTKLLVRNNNRNFIVDAQDVIYATIDNGLITLVATNVEGQSNYRTIEDLQANLDRDTFWRVHRSYLVNIDRIKEVVPWFKSSYQLRMDDKKQTEIPVSRAQTKRLRELFNL